MRQDPARGSASVEVAVLAPAFIGLVVLATVVGRTAIAQEALDTAAHDAARAVSIARTAADAESAATRAVRERLDWEHVACAGEPRLEFRGWVNGAAHDLDHTFGTPVGTDASVSVRVSCVVTVRDVDLEVLDVGDRTVVSTFTSPLDRYRARS
jgi:Flp pilus assembly protein TadG